ncbi:MAG: hypothetical protein ACRDK7_07655 [Solirubrobacteraceae bacterium]
MTADDPPPPVTAPVVNFFKDEHRNDIRDRLRQRRATERQDPSVADLRASIASTAGDGATDSNDAGTTQATTTPGGDGQVPSPPGNPTPAAAAPAPAPAAETGFTVVTVNGMAFEVPTGEVNARGGVRAYQMEKAAEISLANAKRLEREAQDRMRQATAPAAPTAAAPASGRPAPADPAVDETELAQELLDGVLESDTVRIAKVFGKVRGQAPASQPAAAPAPAPAAPVPAPADFGRHQQDLTAGNQVFDQEFGFLRERPGAFERARADIIAALQDVRNSGVPAYLLVRKIGTDITQLTGGRPAAGGAPSPAAREALEQRRTVKARLPISSAAGARAPIAAPTPAATPKQKTSSYIANLRARSGSNASIAERRATR